MDYEGPTVDDLANIHALNSAFLQAATGPASVQVRGLLERRLNATQLQRLTSVPFLLFSFRENDAVYWEHILADRAQFDLLEDDAPPDTAVRELQIAGLGFLWQLSRRNPYAARVVCGAPSSWCERLAAVTLVSLLRRAACRGDLLVPRFVDQHDVWRRLLKSGVSAKQHLQSMSQQFALQAMLTRSQTGQYEGAAAAACGMDTPLQRIGPLGQPGKENAKV